MIEYSYSRLSGQAVASTDLVIEHQTDFSLLPSSISGGATVWAMCWTAVRDGAATFSASVATMGLVIGMQSLLSAHPFLRHLLGPLTATIGGLAGLSFGRQLGGVVGERRGQWVGGGLAGATGLGLTLVMIYTQDTEEQGRAAASVFGTVFYSALRDFFQGVAGKRAFPRMTLNSGRALRWEPGNNTSRHTCRLGIGFFMYTATCALLNGVAARNVVSPNFGTPDQPLESFSADLVKTYGFRTLNEAWDAFFGGFMVAAMFPRSTRPGPGWCSGQGDGVEQWRKEAGSRVSMNLFVANMVWFLPKGTPSWIGPGLTGITEFRGAMANLQPRFSQHEAMAPERQPSSDVGWMRAGGMPTRGGGDCLLDAAAGQVVNGEWQCSDPDTLRQRLAARIEALANEEDGWSDPRVRGLVEYHLQQAVAHVNARQGVEGYERVVDGDDLIDTLPLDAQRELEGCATRDQRIDRAGALQADPGHNRALLRSVARYYRTPRRYMPTNMVPLLAEVSQQTLALHSGASVVAYDHNGTLVEGDLPSTTVHVRHGVSAHGEAADHFERIQWYDWRIVHGEAFQMLDSEQEEFAGNEGIVIEVPSFQRRDNPFHRDDR